MRSSSSVALSCREASDSSEAVSANLRSIWWLDWLSKKACSSLVALSTDAAKLRLVEAMLCTSADAAARTEWSRLHWWG
eukprot:scaffold22894_cov26-Tisochrysis_lutea.AAC.2